jgi:hypothetical protein
MPCPGWPDVSCLGRSGRQFLEDVILRAQAAADPRARDASAAAARFRDRTDSPLSCEEQCAKAYAAHAAAQADPPDWTAVLSALEDPLAVPAAAAAFSSGPTVVSEDAPAGSRASSSARVRRPAKRAPRKKAKKAPARAASARKRRPAKRRGGAATAAKRSKATRTRGKKPAARGKKAAPRGSRSRPKGRKRR